MSEYWESRKDCNYYKKVIERINCYCNYYKPSGKFLSILDVGCADTPIATHGRFIERYTVDIKKWPQLPNVSMIVGDFRTVELPRKKFSIVTCLQTIEHIVNPRDFVQRLIEVTNAVLIISIPWMWRVGACPGHVNDPMDAETMFSLTDLQPNNLLIVKDGYMERAIFEYIMSVQNLVA
jgi:hypothetical protein